MKIFNNKKSMILILFLAIFTVFLLMPSLYIRLESKRDIFTAPIGELQSKILDISYENNHDLFYIEQSARYAAMKTLNELEQKGGYFQSSCGDKNNYSIWQDKYRSCFPKKEDLIISLDKILKSKLDNYLDKMGFNPDYDFYFVLEDNFVGVTGTPLRDIETNISFKNNIIGKHSIKPSFELNISYNISTYHELIQRVSGRDGLIDKVSECEKTHVLKECMDIAIGQINKNSSLRLDLDCDRIDKKEDRFFYICTNNTDEIYDLPDKEHGLKKNYQKIKFALFIKDLPPSAIDFDILNHPVKDETIILRWQNPKEQDIENYSIYYAEKTDLMGKEISKIEKDPYINKIVLSKKEMLGILNPITECNLNTKGKCEPYPPKQTLLQDKDDYLYVILDNLAPEEYFIALTATDTSGNKIKKIENSLKFSPKDNLAPAKIKSLSYDLDNRLIRLQPPQKNIDGTKLEDDLRYFYFLKQGNCNKLSLTLEENYITDKRWTEEGIRAKFESEKGNFCLIAIASDKKGNPIEIVTEENINKLKLKSPYIGVFNNLYIKHQISIP